MKTWKISVVAALLGLVVGFVAAVAQVLLWPWPDGPWAFGAARPVVDLSQPQPLVHVDEDSYDFGAMDSEAQGRHAFTLRNVGQAPLVLEAGPTTCKCTASIVDRGVLAPGESTDVVVEWTGKDYTGSFTQTATILTNDPRRTRVTLTISGRVVQAVRVEPAEVYFSRITAGAPATATFRILGFRKEPLELLNYELEDGSTSDLFEVTFEPLSEQQLQGIEGVRCGYLGRLTIKPGLPLGSFRQRLIVKTSSTVAPTISVPIRGLVGSEISVIGSGWNERQGTLYLGNVSGQTGAQKTLLIRAGGPLRHQIQLKILDVQPALLQVELGQTKDLPDAEATITPVTIRIPPGSPPADHWGATRGSLGQILLETKHPKAPQLKILVSFAVAG